MEQLDYVVNVAGADPKYPIDTITLREWDKLVDLNLRAYYFVIKAASRSSGAAAASRW